MKINDEMIIDLSKTDGEQNEEILAIRVTALKNVQNEMKELKDKETKIKESLVIDGINKFKLIEKEETLMTLSITDVVSTRKTIDWESIATKLSSISGIDLSELIPEYSKETIIKSKRYTWGKK